MGFIFNGPTKNYERIIILDNKHTYFNTLSNKNFIKRLILKIRYISHINRKKRCVML